MMEGPAIQPRGDEHRYLTSRRTYLLQIEPVNVLLLEDEDLESQFAKGDDWQGFDRQ